MSGTEQQASTEERAIALLKKLAVAESEFRWQHDQHGSEGAEVAQAWHQLRREGDAARFFLAEIGR